MLENQEENTKKTENDTHNRLFGRNITMERKRTNRPLDLGTLMIYVLLSMAFAIAAIVLAALVLQADILAWNQTLVVTLFFSLTGGICSVFLLLK